MEILQTTTEKLSRDLQASRDKVESIGPEREILLSKLRELSPVRRQRDDMRDRYGIILSHDGYFTLVK